MRRSALRKQITILLTLFLCTTLISAFLPFPKSIAFAKPKVLIFSKTNGYHHASIAVGIEAIKKLGLENGFEVDSTTDSLMFKKKILKKYAALIFLSPTGKVF